MSSYVEDPYDSRYGLPRVPDFTVTRSSPAGVKRLQEALRTFTPVRILAPEWRGMVYVLKWVSRGDQDAFYRDKLEFTVRPTGEPEVTPPPGIRLRAGEPVISVAGIRNLISEPHIDLPPFNATIYFNPYWIGDDMKVYEAIVIKNDENGKPAEIAKVVTPFLATTPKAASDAVLVDFAREANLSGKDLAGYQVRVQECFPVS